MPDDGSQSRTSAATALAAAVGAASALAVATRVVSAWNARAHDVHAAAHDERASCANCAAADHHDEDEDARCHCADDGATRDARRPTTSTLACPPPGSMGLPIIGETQDMLGGRGRLHFHAERVARHSQPGAPPVKAFTTHYVGSPTVVSNDVAVNSAMFKAEQQERAVPGIAGLPRMLAGPHSIFVLTGAGHARMRRLVMRSFTPDAVRSHADAIDACVRQFLEGLAATCEADPAARLRSSEFRRLSVDALCAAAFDADDVPREDRARIVALFDDVASAFVGLIPWPLPFTAARRGCVARETLVDIIKRIVDKRRAGAGASRTSTSLLARLVAAVDDEEENAGGGADAGARGALAADEIADVMLALLYAGADTSACFLSTLASLSAEHADVVRRLRDEVEATLGSDASAPLDPVALTRAPFLNAVVNEGLRLVPPLLNTVRRATCEIPIPGTSWTIPTGWKFMTSLVPAHHDDAFWGEGAATRFDPDRFLAKQQADAARLGYFAPFGAGTRMCAVSVPLPWHRSTGARLGTDPFAGRAARQARDAPVPRAPRPVVRVPRAAPRAAHRLHDAPRD